MLCSGPCCEHLYANDRVNVGVLSALVDNITHSETDIALFLET